MRLTKDLKQSVQTKALAGFKATEIAQLTADIRAFACKVYDYEFAAEAAVASQLSERWYTKTSDIEIKCDGFSWHNGAVPGGYEPVHLSWDTINENISLGEDRIFPADYNGTYNVVEIDTKHPLYKEARQLVKRWNEILKVRSDVVEKIDALLASVNTCKQLEAAWPEAMDFLPKGATISTALVPVGLSDQINKALGIQSQASVATQAVRKAAAK